VVERVCRVAGAAARGAAWQVSVRIRVRVSVSVSPNPSPNANPNPNPNPSPTAWQLRPSTTTGLVQLCTGAGARLHASSTGQIALGRPPRADLALFEVPPG